MLILAAGAMGAMALAAAALAASQAADPAGGSGDGPPACAAAAAAAPQAAAAAPLGLQPLPCAAAEDAGMSIAVALADDFLVMREGGVHLRGDIVAHNYDPREGHMFQEIRREPGGPVVTKTKIFIRTGADNAWVAQVGSLLSPDDYAPGDYSIRIVTESGLGSPRARFTVSDRPAPDGGISAPGQPGATARPDAPADIAGILPDAPADIAGILPDAPADIAGILPDAPADIAGILPDAPADIAGILPDAPADIAKAPQPGAPGGLPRQPEEGSGPPAETSAPAVPEAGKPYASVRPVPTHPPGVGPSSSPPGFDPLGYLSGLPTASYLASIILSVIISFFVMMAIRAALRRSRRSRRRSHSLGSRRPDLAP